MPKTEIEQFMTEMVSDRQRFIETLVQIKDEQKRVLPFLFKAAQVDFEASMQDYMMQEQYRLEEEKEQKKRENKWAGWGMSNFDKYYVAITGHLPY